MSSELLIDFAKLFLFLNPFNVPQNEVYWSTTLHVSILKETWKLSESEPFKN